MFRPKEIVFRLDDFSVSRHIKRWETILDIFHKHQIKVCIGVIPKCEDPTLNYQFISEENQFWADVRMLDSSGHTIALHGYKHTYHSCKRENSIIPIHPYSEFTGLCLGEQKRKISKSFEIFVKNGLAPEVFMAPAHTFDLNTLTALKETTPIRYISDGTTNDCFLIENMRFIPQQFGKLRPPRFRLNCYCLHPNTMKRSDFDKLEYFLDRYKVHIQPFSQFRDQSFKKLNSFDYIVIQTFKLLRNLRGLVR